MGEAVTSYFLVLILEDGMEGEEAVESADQTQKFGVSFVHLLFIQHAHIGARPSCIKA
jgi:hypothetical protein